MPCKFPVGMNSRLGGREHLISTQGVMRSSLAAGRRGIDRGQGDAVFCRYGPGSSAMNDTSTRAPGMANEWYFADLALAQRVEGAWDFLGVENARSQKKRAPESGVEVIEVGGGHAVFLGTG